MHDRTKDGINDPPEKLRPEGAPLIKEVVNTDKKGVDQVRGIEELEKEIERLKRRYEKPGMKCNSGHKNTLPIKLWDCPICTEKLRKEKEWLIDRVVGNKYSTVSDDKKRMKLLYLMQQALKEVE